MRLRSMITKLLIVVEFFRPLICLAQNPNGIYVDFSQSQISSLTQQLDKQYTLKVWQQKGSLKDVLYEAEVIDKKDIGFVLKDTINNSEVRVRTNERNSQVSVGFSKAFGQSFSVSFDKTGKATVRNVKYDSHMSIKSFGDVHLSTGALIAKSLSVHGRNIINHSRIQADLLNFQALGSDRSCGLITNATEGKIDLGKTLNVEKGTFTNQGILNFKESSSVNLNGNNFINEFVGKNDLTKKLISRIKGSNYSILGVNHFSNHSLIKSNTALNIHAKNFLNNKDIFTEQDLSIHSDGDFTNLIGKIRSKQNAFFEVGRNFNNNASIYGEKSTNINVAKILTNDGYIYGGKTHIKTPELHNNKSILGHESLTLLGGEVGIYNNISGVISCENLIDMNISHLINLNLISSRDQVINAISIQNKSIIKSNNKMNINALRIKNDENGNILANNGKITAYDQLLNDGDITFTDVLGFEVHHLINNNIIQSNKIAAHIDILKNECIIRANSSIGLQINDSSSYNNGLIKSNNIFLRTKDLFTNNADIIADEAINYTSSGHIINTHKGLIISDGIIKGDSIKITNLGLIKANKNILIKSENLHNKSTIISNDIGLILTGAESINEGKIVAQENFTGTIFFLNNEGEILANNSECNINYLINSGLLSGRDNLSLITDHTENYGVLKSSEGRLVLTTQDGSSINKGYLYAKDVIALDTGLVFKNSGEINAGNAVLHDSKGTVKNLKDGVIFSKRIKSTINRLINSGLIIGNENVFLTTNHTANNGVLKTEEGRLILRTQDDVSVNKGEIYSKDVMALDTGVAFKNSGKICSETDIIYQSNGVLENTQNALLTANKNISVNAKSFINDGILYAHETALLTLETLHNNKHGRIKAPKAVLVINHDGSVNNGIIEGSGELIGDIRHIKNNNRIIFDIIKANIKNLENTGYILANYLIEIETDSLLNAGSILSEKNLILTTYSDKSINAGTISGKDNCVINAGKFFLNSGTISSENGTTAIYSNDKFKSTGLIAARNEIIAHINDFDLIGSIQSDVMNFNIAHKLAIGKGNITGRILSFLGDGIIFNIKGKISGEHISFRNKSITNRGTIKGLHNLDFINESLINKREILCDQALDIKSNYFSNSSLVKAGTVSIDADTFENKNLIDGLKSTINSKNFKNTGTIQSTNENLIMRVDSGENEGNLIAEKGASITINDLLKNMNPNSLIRGNEFVQIEGSGKLENAGTLLSLDNIVFNNTSVLNNGLIQANKDCILGENLVQFMNESNGDIQILRTLFIQGVLDVINSGKIALTGQLQGDKATLTNTAGGAFGAKGNVILAHTKNTGDIIGYGKIDFRSKTFLNNASVSGDALSIYASTFNNKGTVESTQYQLNLYIDSGENTGILKGEKGTTLDILTLFKNSGLEAVITGNGQIVTSGTGALENTGSIETLFEIIFGNTSIQNNGYIKSNENIILSEAVKAFLNEGNIHSDNSFIVNSVLNIVNTGKIYIAGMLNAIRCAFTNNKDSTLAIKGDITLNHLQNDGDIIGSDTTIITAGTFVNTGHTRGKAITVKVDNFDNKGTVQSTEGLLTLQVKAGGNTGNLKGETGLALNIENIFKNNSLGAALFGRNYIHVNGLGAFENIGSMDSLANIIFGNTSITNNGSIQSKADLILNDSVKSFMNGQLGRINVSRSFVISALLHLKNSGNVVVKGILNAATSTIENLFGGILNTKENVYLTHLLNSGTYDAGIGSKTLDIKTITNQAGGLVHLRDAVTFLGNYIHNSGQFNIYNELLAPQTNFINDGIVALETALKASFGGYYINNNLTSGESLSLEAASIINNKKLCSTKGLISLITTSGNFENNAEVLSAGQLTIRSVLQIINKNKIHSNGTSTFVSQKLQTLDASDIQSVGQLSIQSGQVDLQAGTLKSTSDIAINTQHFNNNAQMSSDTSIAIATGTIGNLGIVSAISAALMVSGQPVVITNSMNFDVEQTMTIRSALGIVYASNPKVRGVLDLEMDHFVPPADGLILDGGLKLKTKCDLTFSMPVRLGGRLTIETTGAVSNTNRFDVAKGFDITANRILNGGLMYGGADSRLVCENNILNTNTIYTQGNLELTAKAGELNNYHGVIEATGVLTGNASTRIRNQAGKIRSLTHTILRAPLLENMRDPIRTIHGAKIATHTTSNPGGRFHEWRDGVHVELSQEETSGASEILSNQLLTIDCHAIINEASHISSIGKMILNGSSINNLSHYLERHLAKKAKVQTKSRRLRRGFSRKFDCHRWLREIQTPTYVPATITCGDVIEFQMNGVTRTIAQDISGNHWLINSLPGLRNTGRISGKGVTGELSYLVNGIFDSSRQTPAPRLPSAVIPLSNHLTHVGEFGLYRENTTAENPNFVITPNVPIGADYLAGLESDLIELVNKKPERFAAKSNSLMQSTNRFLMHNLVAADILRTALINEIGSPWMSLSVTNPLGQLFVLMQNGYEEAKQLTCDVHNISQDDISHFTKPALVYEPYAYKNEWTYAPTLHLPEAVREALKQTAEGQILADHVALHCDADIFSSGTMRGKEKLHLNARRVYTEQRLFKTQETVYQTTGYIFKETKATTYDVSYIQPGGNMHGGDVRITGRESFESVGGSFIGTSYVGLFAQEYQMRFRPQIGTHVEQWDVGKYGDWKGVKNSAARNDYHLVNIISAGDADVIAAKSTAHLTAPQIVAKNNVKVSGKKGLIIDGILNTVEKSSVERKGLRIQQTISTSVEELRANISGRAGDVSLESLDGGLELSSTSVFGLLGIDQHAKEDINNKAVTATASQRQKTKGINGFSFSDTKTHSTKTEISSNSFVTPGVHSQISDTGSVINQATDITAGHLHTKAAVAIRHTHVNDVSTHESESTSVGISFFGSKAIEAAMNGQSARRVINTAIQDSALLSSIQQLSSGGDRVDIATGAVQALCESQKFLAQVAQSAQQGQNPLTSYLAEQAAKITIGLQETYHYHEVNRAVGNHIKTGLFSQEAPLIEWTDGGEISAVKASIKADDWVISAASSSEHTTHSSQGMSVTTSMRNPSDVSVGANVSESESNATTHNPHYFKVSEDLDADIQNDMTVRGSFIRALRAKIAVGGNLIGQSLQNTSEGGGFCASASVGMSSVSGSYSQDEQSRHFVDDLASISGIEKLILTVGKETNLQGFGIYADNDDLEFTTDTLVTSDIHNSETSSSTSVSLSTDIGASQKGICGSISGDHQSRNQQGVTRATIGRGNVSIISDPTSLNRINRDTSKAQETTSDEKSHYGAYIPLVNINAFNKEMKSISEFFTPEHTKRPEFAGHQDKFGLLQDVAETLVESGLSLQAAEQLLEDDKIAIVLNQAEQFDKADDDAGNSAVLKFSRGRGKVGHRLAALETALFDGPALSSDPVTDRALKTIELASAILNDHRIRHASTAPALAKALAVGLNGAAIHVVACGISSSASGVKQSLYNLAVGMIGENPSQTLGLSAAVDNAYKDADRAAKIHQKARHVVKKSASVSIETGSVLTMMMESSTSYQDPLIDMERGRSLVRQERTPEQILETSPERLKDTWLSKHKSEARSFVQDCHETRKKWSPKSSTIDHVKAIVSAGISFSKSVQETAAFSMKIVKLIPVPRIRATVAVLEAQAYLTDVACKFIETWVRRSVRVVTGNPGAAQDAGECLAFVAAVVNPNKAAKLGNLTKITSKVSKVEQLATSSTPAPKPMTIASSSTPSTASATKQTTAPLLPGEGRVGSYAELKKCGTEGDNLARHHIPNDNYMTSRGVPRSEGVSIMAEHPTPGVGGRHREIHKGMIAQDVTLSPRDALAQSIRRAQEVYKKDGVYTDEIRKSLRDVIDLNKSKFPHLFEKG